MSESKKMSKAAFAAARKALYDSYGPSKPKKSKPLSVSYYSDGSREKYPSLETKGMITCSKTSVMSPEVLKNESEEVRAEILNKAKRISPIYNKGNYQYVTDLEMKK